MLIERDEKMNIYVGNLDYQLNEDNIKPAFQAYGEVESVRIITDRDTGSSKGFCFVEMPEKEEALKAIEALNGTDLGGKLLPSMKHAQNHRAIKVVVDLVAVVVVDLVVVVVVDLVAVTTGNDSSGKPVTRKNAYSFILVAEQYFI